MNIAEDLMLDFAENTGLTSNKPPRRYLWTDAFAVCNFIQLYKQTKNKIYKQYSIDLIDQVHSTLGKHREDDSREGWLSKDPDRPTKNGLRIGKRLPEREKDERIDESLEWERDGQYFHYLTKWMVALINMGGFLDEKKYILWAADLVKASQAFIHDSRMYWKMSIDLSRPLVRSMGQHDPLDGYVVYKLVNIHTEESLNKEVEDMFTIARTIRLETMDPLGIGSLLIDAYHLYQMGEDEQFLQDIINAAKYGIQYFNTNNHSLAFRELGLAIGLEASRRMNELTSYWEIKDRIIKYWVENRDWREHIDINQVMLSTSLVPNQFLEI
ncbi:MAG: hypothetical protein R6W84_17915 [Promethearchaeia archaeon]